MEWTLEAVQKRLGEIKAKGFIPIPEGMYRKDDGIVGQILEREFGIVENNISLGDLGKFELKGIRRKSSNLTLSHKTPEKGLNPTAIFHRFGYRRTSQSKPGVFKKNLFVTVNGVKPNPLGLKLRGIHGTAVDMVYGDEFLSEWDLTNPLKKIDQIILAVANTTGATKASDEKFHYERAFLLDGLKPLKELIDTGIIVIEFCIDQPIMEDGTPLKPPHDRGPHIRVPMRKLRQAYKEVTEILK